MIPASWNATRLSRPPTWTRSRTAETRVSLCSSTHRPMLHQLLLAVRNLNPLQALEPKPPRSLRLAAPAPNRASGCSGMPHTLPQRPPCPATTCSAQYEPRVVKHSLLHTNAGPIQRWRCKNCGHTFTRRTGTAYHRLRNPPSRFDRVAQMIVEGSTKAATARINGVSPATVGRWSLRASQFAARFADRAMREVIASELQADELRGFTENKQSRQFVFVTLEVGARLWLSTVVGRRTKRSTRLLVRDSRRRIANGQSRILFTTDPFRYYRHELRKAWGPTCLHVESGKAIRGGRVVRVRNRVTNGDGWQLERVLARCEDSKKPNTSYIERLNLYIRRSLSYLHRRTPGLAGRHGKLEEAIRLLQCYYNFVRPHSSLPHKTKKDMITPAMQAKLVTRRLTLRDIFQSFGPRARLPWLVNQEARNEWGKDWACSGSNS